MTYSFALQPSDFAAASLDFHGGWSGLTRAYLAHGFFVAAIVFVSGVESLLCSSMADRLANNKRRRRGLPQPDAAPQRTLKGPLDYITDEYRELVDGYGDDLDDEDDMP